MPLDLPLLVGAVCSLCKILTIRQSVCTLLTLSLGVCISPRSPIDTVDRLRRAPGRYGRNTPVGCLTLWVGSGASRRLLSSLCDQRAYLEYYLTYRGPNLETHAFPRWPDFKPRRQAKCLRVLLAGAHAGAVVEVVPGITYLSRIRDVEGHW